MEERYQIKGKIGQGGLGAVYRAFDIRMNREVAIKRIITDLEDKSISEEATRQLVKEAGSLASLQHPNIVTIYDVGSDEDGPFVVMELLTGDTLEKIISDGSFTWVDFRELAMQTMEALIAAQELNLVHRDLKPGNIMVNWLPSGKFQVKIVDFGLAKLTAKPSLQTIDQSDGVFGSIYFMAPEQFERVPLDLKVDLYAIGCVFYYALTGTYPFDGEHAAEVMASHLQHHVSPLQEVREGIPIWVCDWIMWHLNRQPSDRPESARQSLQVFVENDTAHKDPPMSTGIPSTPSESEPPKRPKLLIPGSAPAPEVVPDPTPTQRVKTASIPKPLEPPRGSKPSIHTGSQVIQSAPEPPAAAEPEVAPTPVETIPVVEQAPVEPEEKPAPVLSRATSTPAANAPVLKKATLTTPATEQTAITNETVEAAPETPAAAEPDTPPIETPPIPVIVPATSDAKSIPILSRASTKPAASAPILKKASGSPTAPAAKPISPAPATGQVVAIPGKVVAPIGAAPPIKTAQVEESTPTPAAIAPPKKGISPAAKMTIAAMIGILTLGLAVALLKKSEANAEAKIYNNIINQVPAKQPIPIKSRELEILLTNAAAVGSTEDRTAVYMALVLAETSDGTDIDKRIAEFATTKSLVPNIRVILLGNVLRQRKSPEIVDTLISFAKSTDEPESAVAAIEGVRETAADKHLTDILSFISSEDSKMRAAAEENAVKIIARSSAKDSLGSQLADAYGSASEDAMRHAMLRLLGRIGGDKAMALAKENLASADKKDQIAAIVALENWSTPAGFNALVEFIPTTAELDIRARAFSSAYQYALEDPKNAEKNWTLLETEAKTQDEQIKVIRGVANVKPAPWAFALLEKIAKNSDDEKAVDFATRAIDRLKDIQRVKGDGKKEEEE
ncbi:MAG: protein kinase [Akkermansiaceae bacterium]|nr:protein kinase [Akkermansiaceae bacterium]MDP4722393.1 protein kinase [Akkermansiaceae bacterium]MDP4848146.1 protein kinase [Akkermansiaceae bacterium]MDP4995203.1 protein kinase [Akkermansiaceae bacterium]